MKNIVEFSIWQVKGSYFNMMFQCGNLYNPWLHIALGYLPDEELCEIGQKIAFFSTAQRDACRLARKLCEEREIILLSERILPKKVAEEHHSNVRYFIFCVLHEVAHAIKKHRSPLLDDLSPEDNQAQENEAEALAFDWFNKHVELRNNAYYKPITIEEIRVEKEKNQKLMEELYEGY